MLARNRFNRVHVVFQRIEAPYRLPKLLSHTAAEYGIDFTLGVARRYQCGGAGAHADPLSVDARSGAGRLARRKAAVFSALRVTGRRVTLDLDGATAQPGVLQEALASGIPVLRPAAAWPPSFEVAPPIDAADAEAHPVFYEVMGRLSYDPKTQA